MRPDGPYDIDQLDAYLIEMSTGRRRKNYLSFSSWVAREAYNKITSLERQIDALREENRLLREKGERKMSITETYTMTARLKEDGGWKWEVVARDRPLEEIEPWAEIYRKNNIMLRFTKKTITEEEVGDL